MAVAVETNAAIDADANRGVGGKPDPAHQGEQLLPCADPGAAIAQVVRGALEHGDVPAGASQQMGGEQAADRAADDQCASLRQACAPLHRDGVHDGDPHGARKRLKSALVEVSRNVSRARFDWYRVSMATGFCAGFASRQRYERRSIESARNQMPSAFDPHYHWRFAGFSWVIKKRIIAFAGLPANSPPP